MISHYWMWGRGEEDLFGVDELQPPFLSLTMCLRKRSGNLEVEHIWHYLGEYGLELEWTIYNVVLRVTHSNFHLVMKNSNLN